VKILDLFCCGGGAAMGMSQGFDTQDITGVDILPQPKYPFKFIQGNALEIGLFDYDFIWASPPCQAFTKAQKLRGNTHPDLLEPIRIRLKDSGIPYCIENVVGAPLLNPILLCGAMFGLKTYRHRLFETSFPIKAPKHPEHSVKQTKMGRKPVEGEFIQVVGNFIGIDFAKEAMGIDWLSTKEMAQAIPPAYSKYIAENFLLHKAGLNV
jgi:DNA (cytosine-5)-methyltransferase 1